MRHWMLVTLALVVLSTSAGAAGLNAAKKIDNELSFIEWSGPEAFVKRLRNENVDPCEFLRGAESRYKKDLLVIRRVLLSLNYTQCSNKKMVVQKYLKSTNLLLRESAIRLASSLPSNQRKEVEPRIMELKATDHDFAITSAISDFFQTR